MRKKLAPAFIQLTQDACLKAFWRRRTLRTFLQQHQISEAKLATWNEDESKRDFLFRLFPSPPLIITILEDYEYMLSLKEKLESIKQLLDSKPEQRFKESVGI